VSDAPTPQSATRTEVGQPAPPVAVTTLQQERFELAAQRGRVVLLNFWATWCPPCRQEMPALQAQVWERFGAREDFRLVSIAREETAAEIRPFVAEHGYGWTFAPDPERTVYARYAGAFIPRNYVIGRDGAILFQGHGHEPEEFARMVEVIAGALAARD
jgi:thiol-disulfide isomerase/thioredoxin